MIFLVKKKKVIRSSLASKRKKYEVDELNETIASLQGKISTFEKINDQLRASNMCINLETVSNIKPIILYSR